MPIAVATDVPQHFLLKTLPADPKVEGPNGEAGYVNIRRLTFGEKQTRRSINSKMTVKASKGKKDVDTVIDAFNEKTDFFDFANCIVSHNLQAADGSPLDFRNVAHVQSLAGNVAEEISTYIDQVNNFEADEDAGN